MLYFPQLSTGALTQYPLSKMREARTVVNLFQDGRALRLLDGTHELVEWRMSLTGLNGAERNAIESLFQSTEGRLGEFTFLDPTDNLLRWSEDLTAETWEKGPLVSLAAAFADPAGTERATRAVNTGAAAQRIEQSIEGPARFQYCFSVCARADVSTPVVLYSTDGTMSADTRATAGPSWRRLAHSSRLESASEATVFGLELGPGAAVELYGFQAECQPAASAYRRTTTRSGVYERSRFGDDVLTLTADGPGEYSCAVRIVAGM
jgi:hypothetical protein